jgi:hypothetical protein
LALVGRIDYGGGMGHGDTETLQEQAHLDLFLSHIRQRDQTGNILCISLDKKLRPRRGGHRARLEDFQSSNVLTPAEQGRYNTQAVNYRNIRCREVVAQH